MAELRLGVIGYGWFAELLHDRVMPGIDRLAITAVCEPDPGRRRQAAERLGVPAYASAEELLAGSDCEAVAIFTPHATHRELVELAAAAGRHVFCEKAMAVTSEDCRAMIDAAERAGVVLCVGHMQKLFPPYARVAELVRSGRYGAPVAAAVAGFHWCPVFPGWWRRRRESGGLLYWTGIHDLDTLRHVMGSEVERVHAFVAPQTDAYTDYEDAIVASLRFAGGAIASIHVAEHAPLREFEQAFSLDVVCERGAVAFDPVRNVVTHAGRDGLERGDVVTERFGSHETSMLVAYREEFEHFVAVVRDGVAPVLTGEDGLRCVEILEAISAAVEADQAVDVPRAPADALR